MTELAPPPVVGTHPETGLYHADHMPPAEDPVLRTLREKQLAGEPLTMAESMRAGRDVTVDKIGDYELRPDHVYRTVGEAGLKAYMETGMIVSPGEDDDEFEVGNNHGIDWYLGAVALKYGTVILEAPADPAYFQPALHQGHALAKDPRVRHMKSSGRRNPVPFDNVRVISTGPATADTADRT